MSFDQDIRSTGSLKDLLRNLKRRLQRTEFQKDEKEQLQGHVNKIRTQLDFMDSYDYLDNIASNAIGPYDFIFEPDYTEVMIYQPFENPYGDGVKLTKTLNGVNYDVIEIGDTNQVFSTVSTGTYHYEPYGIFNGTSDYVEQADAASLDLLQFSVAAWFRTSNNYSSNDAMIINKGGFGSDTAGENMNYG